MTLALTPANALLAILLMVVVTYLTRIGGVLIMARVPIGPRVERFIHAMSGSVLIAVVVPVAAEGDWGARIALLATLVAILITRKPLIAIAAGIVSAALWRALF